MDITNKKVLITGGTRGIGYELVKKLYEKNNDLIVVAKNEKGLISLKETYPRISTFQVDLSDLNSVDHLINQIRANHRRLDVLINNAAIQHNYYTEKYFGEDYVNDLHWIQEEINVNHTAPIKLIAGCFDLLKKNYGSSIVNICSGLGISPKFSAPVYSSTKSALSIFSEAIRTRYEEFGIRVLQIFPSLTDTEMASGRGINLMNPKKVAKEIVYAIEDNTKDIVFIGDNKLWIKKFYLNLPNKLNKY